MIGGKDLLITNLELEFSSTKNSLKLIEISSINQVALV